MKGGFSLFQLGTRRAGECTRALGIIARYKRGQLSLKKYFEVNGPEFLYYVIIYFTRFGFGIRRFQF